MNSSLPLFSVTFKKSNLLVAKTTGIVSTALARRRRTRFFITCGWEEVSSLATGGILMGGDETLVCLRGQRHSATSSDFSKTLAGVLYVKFCFSKVLYHNYSISFGRVIFVDA